MASMASKYEGQASQYDDNKGVDGKSDMDKEDFETLVVGGIVFGTLMCGVFDVLNKLTILRVLDHGIANKPFMGRQPLSCHFQR